MPKSKVVKPNEINWEPHPQLANAKVAYLLSNRDEKVDLTCLLVHLPAGIQVEKHTHDNSDDIVYVEKERGKCGYMRWEMCRWLREPSSGFRKASCINRTTLRRT